MAAGQLAPVGADDRPRTAGAPGGAVQNEPYWWLADGAARPRRRALHRRRRSGSRVGKLARVVLSVAAAACIAITLAFGVLLRRGNDGVAEILGHPVLVVLSGSMTPTFRPGDLIVDRGRPGTELLHKGQVITFEEPGSGSQILVTHRIFRVVKVAASTSDPTGVGYVTKGDANNGPDPWTVEPSQVLGMYQWRLPWGGYILRLLESRWSFLVGLLAAAAWIFSGTFARMWRATATPRDRTTGDTAIERSREATAEEDRL